MLKMGKCLAKERGKVQDGPFKVWEFQNYKSFPYPRVCVEAIFLKAQDSNTILGS